VTRNRSTVKTKEIFNAPAKQHVGQEGAEENRRLRLKTKNKRISNIPARLVIQAGNKKR
jgi:hypothetical protein